MISDGINLIKEILRKQELDVRKTHNSRWIDQKCTPDVICAISDIVDTISSNNTIDSQHFNSEDVWYSRYSIEFIPDIFDKVDPSLPEARSEYNKFFQQPLNLLSYAGILTNFKEGRTNYYKINNSEALQYIGMSDRNALRFLNEYIVNVLKDSGLYSIFSDFLREQTKSSFMKMKDQFVSFCHKNTKIKGSLEPRRMFPKIINPLAHSEHKLGSHRGYLSKEIISFSELMYNKKNFFDIYSDKPKNISRKVWLSKHPIVKSQLAKFKLDSEKAKKYVRRLNNEYFKGSSELHDKYSAGKATQMHHIFPASEFPEISGYVENIIAITPTQHYTKAHPENNTNVVDQDYMELLLKAKASTISKVIEDKNIEQIYSFNKFDHVLDTGFDDFDSSVDDLDNATFNTAMNKINLHYSKS